METIEINMTDNYGEKCIRDSVNASKKSDSLKPEGYVEIYEMDDNGNRVLVSKSNLVLYMGREWIAERLTNTNNSATNTDQTMFISWFGIGTGGALATDPFNPISPNSTDTGLLSEVPFNATSTTYGDFRSGEYYKHPFDSVTFQQDSANANHYLIASITTTIGVADCNGSNVNEAALFVSSSTAGGFAGPFFVFSKITFPTITKNNTRQLVFVWYIYV